MRKTLFCKLFEWNMIPCREVKMCNKNYFLPGASLVCNLPLKGGFSKQKKKFILFAIPCNSAIQNLLCSKCSHFFFLYNFSFPCCLRSAYNDCILSKLQLNIRPHSQQFIRTEKNAKYILATLHVFCVWREKNRIKMISLFALKWNYDEDISV